MEIMLDESFINALRDYGLTTYEARAYYVLLATGETGAGVIAKFAGIPQQRIYDTLSSLERKGFVQVMHTNPKRYFPLNVRRALTNRLRQLRAEFNSRIEELKERIQEIEDKAPRPVDSKEGSHVWIIEGGEAITGRIIEMISSAEREVRLAGDRPLFTLNCRGVFKSYLKSGVSLYALGTFEAPCRKEIESVGGRVREAVVDYHYVIVVDGKKMLLVYFDDDGIPSALYTENRDIIKPHLKYFDIIWNKGNLTP